MNSNYHSGQKDTECYFCGCGPPLREHHIIPQRFDGPDSRDNIVELCDLCHTKIERLYDKSFYEWFGIDDEKGKRQFHRKCDGRDCDNQARVKLKHRFLAHRVRYTLTCLPCAAKEANRLHDEMERKYQRQKRRGGSFGIQPREPKPAEEILQSIVRETEDSVKMDGVEL